MLTGMLKAYRRSLGKTLAMSNSVWDVLRADDFAWFETPDRMIVWAMALDLETRPDRDVRPDGTIVTPTTAGSRSGSGRRCRIRSGCSVRSTSHRLAGVLTCPTCWCTVVRRTRPCVLTLLVVYVYVTTRMAMSGSTEFAYDRVFEAHWPDVFRFALAWTNDWAEAEDLAQEAYLRLWNHRARLDWDRPVLPWLLVTVRRLATDRFRRIRRRLADRTGARVARRVGAARWLDVQAAMSELSPLERSALVMTAIEGATYEEAAARARHDGGSAPRGREPRQNEVGDSVMDPSRPRPDPARLGRGRRRRPTSCHAAEADRRPERGVGHEHRGSRCPPGRCPDRSRLARAARFERWHRCGRFATPQRDPDRDRHADGQPKPDSRSRPPPDPDADRPTPTPTPTVAPTPGAVRSIDARGPDHRAGEVRPATGSRTSS